MATAQAFLLNDDYATAYKAVCKDYVGIVTTRSGMRIAVGHHDDCWTSLPLGEYEYAITCQIGHRIYLDVTPNQYPGQSTLWVWVDDDKGPYSGKITSVGTDTFFYTY